MVLGIILFVLLIRGLMANIASKAYYKGDKNYSTPTSDNEFWIVFFFGICGVLILILKKIKNN